MLKIEAVAITVGGHSNRMCPWGEGTGEWAPSQAQRGQELQGVWELAREKGSARLGDFTSHDMGTCNKLQV